MKQPAHPESKARILVVEDEEEIRANIELYLKFRGYEILAARDGREALDALPGFEPDVVVSDLIMPRLDGMGLLHAMAERGAEIPVVIATAYGTMESAIAAMKSGAADYLTKPIDLEYMAQVVERVLERRELRRRVDEQRAQMNRDLQFAARIQRCMLPGPADTPALSVRYLYRPLLEIGGDYITIHPYGDGSIAVALYDVQGHGVSAALTATFIHHFLELRLAERLPPGAVVKAVNDYVHKSLGETHMFVTMIALVAGADGKVAAANAGHPELLLARNGEGGIERYPSNHPLLGVFPEFPAGSREQTFDAGPGGRIVLYTDGVTEAANPRGAFFGAGGLEAWMRQTRGMPPDRALRDLETRLAAFQEGTRSDDLTVAVIDVK